MIPGASRNDCTASPTAAITEPGSRKMLTLMYPAPPSSRFDSAEAKTGGRFPRTVRFPFGADQRQPQVDLAIGAVAEAHGKRVADRPRAVGSSSPW